MGITRVRTLRGGKCWSQTELARRTGMTQSAIARFESGGSVPTLPVLERLAHPLGVELVVQLRTPAA
ncbi:MAG TPA: helix-turn-helix transcriptional regulator [Actinoallomurus sp.]